MIRRRVLFGALFVLLFVLGWWAGRGGAAGGLYGNLDLFIEVLHKVDQNYVNPVEPEKLIDGALHGMLRDLDPYSQYLDAKAYANLESSTHGSFQGVGLELGIRDNLPVVIAPIEGSPAWSAGLRSGDVIVKIDGKSTEGFTLGDVASRLRGPEGTTVTLAVEREGDDEPRDVTLTRRTIREKSVPYAFLAEPGVGYIRLADFSETSASEVRASLADLRRQGARAFVLDLRANPGGLLDQAVDVAGQFLPKGATVVSTRGRARGADQRYAAADARGDVTAPLVVLVDEGSASASEIVAGALQDLDRALIVGQTSFGKGSVQSVFPLAGGRGAVKLTTGLYYTPSGRSIHRPTRAEDADAEDDSGDADSTGVDSAAAAAKPRPEFHTRAGRAVFGGGGITPDVAVTPDTLPPLALEVERRGLALRFAGGWVNAHPGARAVVDDAVEKAWVDHLRALKLVTDEGALTAQRPLLDRMLRRELARRIGGNAAAARVALEGDAALQRALAILRRARAARDVFALARAGEGGAPLAVAPARRAAAR